MRKVILVLLLLGFDTRKYAPTKNNKSPPACNQLIGSSNINIPQTHDTIKPPSANIVHTVKGAPFIAYILVNKSIANSIADINEQIIVGVLKP